MAATNLKPKKPATRTKSAGGSKVTGRKTGRKTARKTSKRY